MLEINFINRIILITIQKILKYTFYGIILINVKFAINRVFSSVFADERPALFRKIAYEKTGIFYMSVSKFYFMLIQKILIFKYYFILLIFLLIPKVYTIVQKIFLN